MKIQYNSIFLFLLLSLKAFTQKNIPQSSQEKQIYSKYRQFFYKYYFLKNKDTLFVKFYSKANHIVPFEENWKLESNAQSKNEAEFTKIHQIALTIKNGIFFQNQALMQYDYLNKQQKSIAYQAAGFIEDSISVCIDIPKMNHFLITELNPRPEIKKPYEKGNTWRSTYFTGDNEGSDKWKKWEGIQQIEVIYSIRGKQTIKTNIGYLECYVVDASAKSPLGESRLVSYFNEKFGFVKLNFTNIDESYLVLDIFSVRQY